MKQILFSASKAFLTLTFLVALSSGVRAQAVEISNNEVPGAVRYIGTKDRMLQFDVNIPALPVKAVLRITDEGGEVLHVEHLKDGSLNKRFMVPAGLCQRLRFEVAGKGVRLKQSFDIARQLEERVVVTASL